MVTRVIPLIFLFGTVISVSYCARILGVFHMSSYSHFVLGETLLKELAKKGHDVTMISSFPQKTPVDNYSDIPLYKLPEIMNKRKSDRNVFDMYGFPIFFIPILMGHVGLIFTESVFQEEAVQNLLKSEEKFDVVIVEQFINDAHKGFAYHFNAPLIILSTIGPSIWTDHLVGNPNPISYAPDLFLSYSAHMTFFQRIMNTLFITFEKLYYHFYFFKKQNEILQKYIPNAPNLYDIMYNTSLILLNSHISYKSSLPHVPNMIEIGGFHVKKPDLLPKDLENFMNSEEGIIYFSLGSNVKSKDMHKEKIEQIIKVIGKLKMKVLWKFEEDNIPNMPNNLKIANWFPQQSILAHPNIKLFISHGGLLSTIESVHYGVPLLGIPIFGDQKMNMAESVDKGYALMIPYNELQEDNFYSAIMELIENPKYLENARIRSKILHDRPIKPLDSAVYWVEYVIRHKGATHFRSPALDLQWYQRLLVDVILFLTAIVFVIMGTSYYLLKYLLKKRKSFKMKQKNE